MMRLRIGIRPYIEVILFILFDNVLEITVFEVGFKAELVLVLHSQFVVVVIDDLLLVEAHEFADQFLD
jgi:hypothetical protein